MAGRIEEARRRAHTAKRALAVGSVAGFLAFLGLARESHAGHASTASGQTAASPTESDDGFFQAPAVTPSYGSGTNVQTHAS